MKYVVMLAVGFGSTLLGNFYGKEIMIEKKPNVI